MTMNTDILKGKWSQLSGALQEKFSLLTDDDMHHISGKYDKLIGKLQEYYGYSEEEAKAKIKDFSTKVIGKAQHAANGLASDAKESFNNFAVRAKETAQNLESNIKEVGSSVNHYAQGSPWTLAAMTTIGGVLIGMLLRSKLNIRNLF